MFALKQRKGFTLVELLVVVIIIALLAGLGYPSYAKIKEHAYVTAMMNSINAAVRAEELVKQSGGLYVIAGPCDDTAPCAALGGITMDKGVSLSVTFDFGAAENGFHVTASHASTTKTCAIDYGLDSDGTTEGAGKVTCS